jgi:uncharacterized protein (DUF169 family)
MDCRTLSSSLMELLRLETLPVAVRLYATAGELPQKPLPFKMNICQLISLARHQGRTAGGVPESMVCSIGAACTGLIAEIGKEFFANTFKLGDQGRAFEAILLAPLSVACDLQPDVVLVYGNPAQIMRLIHGCVFRSGRKVAADTVAEAAVCSAIGFVKATGRPMVGFPCAGDRRFGGTQNSELVFAAPFGMLEEIVTSLQALSKAGPLYPVAPNVMWTPRMPAAYTITEGDLEGWERR